MLSSIRRSQNKSNLKNKRKERGEEIRKSNLWRLEWNLEKEREDWSEGGKEK